MKKTFKIFTGILLLLFSYSASFCQSKISGSVMDRETGEKLNSISVWIPGTSIGTFSDNNGHFNLTANLPFPLQLAVSAIGYRSDTISVISSAPIEIKMEKSTLMGKEIVVAASRLPENILKSPVSIEHIGAQAIRETPSANYYDVIGHLKGVYMVTSGLLFSTPSTRGFSGSGDTRVNQITDGMDNEAPGLNFSIGNVVGISALDIDNIELLPGASSALYGSGGTNGTILLTSKDPFQYQGLSAQVKEGIMHINDPQHKATPYQQYNIRYAKAFRNKWAFKLNLSYIKAYDWIAADTGNYDAENFGIKPGNRDTDPAYDGLNVYGDEISGSMQETAKTLGLSSALIPTQTVTRTGWNEQALVDYNTFNLKLGGTLAYKITPGTKISLSARYGQATTVYTGADRFALKGFHIGQYKIQLDGKHLMLRAYTTQENAGDSYNASTIGQVMNESWKSSPNWFADYVTAYKTARDSGFSKQAAFVQARAVADRGMPQPGSARFNTLLDSIRQLPIPAGAAFKDRSGLYQYEGLYHFSDQIPFINVQIGANYRRYRLRSDGTIFDDKNKKITINQYGVFTQLSKELLENKLKLTGAVRYDKTDHFEGKWTPRIAAVFAIVPENNIRISYQTGYNLPTNQNQYIDLDVGRARVIGGLPPFISKYHLKENPVFSLDNVKEFGEQFKQNYIANVFHGEPDSVAQYNATVAAEKTLQPYQFKSFKPESVQSFEIGYRGIITRDLMVDAYAYRSTYHNFIGSVILLQAKNGPQQISPSDPAKYYGMQLAAAESRNVYATSANSEGIIRTWGWALDARYILPKEYELNANISYNKLRNAPKGFFTQYNTPDYQANVSINNSNVYKGFGFGLNYHFQDAFLYEGSFAVGNISAVHTLDAQISYKIPKDKLLFTIGGTNILNHYYQNAYGNPMIGGIYYFSIGYNVF